MLGRQQGRAKVAAMAQLRDEHVGATRQALLAAARKRFGTLGFAGTSLDDVVADARVSKGALYHHFRNKEHLFLEVYEQVEGELAGIGVEAAAGATNATELLQRGFGAFLDLALEPEIQRISILDAPSVLGTAKKQEIDERYSLAAVRMSIELGISTGDFAAHDPEVLAHLLMSACMQGAQLIATAHDPRAARTEVGAALDHLIAGLAPRT